MNPGFDACVKSVMQEMSDSGLSYLEIAEKYGITRQAVEQRLNYKNRNELNQRILELEARSFGERMIHTATVERLARADKVIGQCKEIMEFIIDGESIVVASDILFEKTDEAIESLREYEGRKA